MDKRFFVDQSRASDFECSICLDVAYPPVLFPCEAQHVFCRRCIAAVEQCPQDREERAGRPLTPLTGMLLRTYRSLKLNCANEGCTWQGDLADVYLHLMQSCARVIVTCALEGCGARCARGDLPAHTEGCMYRTVHCEHCQDAMVAHQVTPRHAVCASMPVMCPSGGERCPLIARSAVAAHETTECPFALVACSWSEFGCDLTCPREMMAAHYASTATSQAHLQLVKGAMQEMKAGMDEMRAGMDEMRASMDEMRVNMARQAVSLPLSSALSSESTSPRRRRRMLSSTSPPTIGALPATFSPTPLGLPLRSDSLLREFIV